MLGSLSVVQDTLVHTQEERLIASGTQTDSRCIGWEVSLKALRTSYPARVFAPA